MARSPTAGVPWIGLTLLAAWIGVQLAGVTDPEAPYARWGLVPDAPTREAFGAHWLVHPGWAPLAANGFLLWLVGPPLEQRWGSGLFAGLVLACATFGAFCYMGVRATSPIPLLGASAVTAGVTAACLVRFGTARLRFRLLAPSRGSSGSRGRPGARRIRDHVDLPAFWIAPLWLAVEGLHSADRLGTPGAVVFWAHLGGFGMGALFAACARLWRFEERRTRRAVRRHQRAVEKRAEARAAAAPRFEEAEPVPTPRRRVEPIAIELEPLEAVGPDPGRRSRQGAATGAAEGAHAPAALCDDGWDLPDDWGNEDAAPGPAAGGPGEAPGDSRQLPPTPPPEPALEIDASGTLSAGPSADVSDDDGYLGLPPDQVMPSALARFASLKSMEAVPLALQSDALALERPGGRQGELAFERIEAVAVAAVANLADKPVLVVQLVLNWNCADDDALRTICLRSDRFDARRLVPGQDKPREAFCAFVAALLERSGAVPLPDAQRARGAPFASYESLAQFAAEVLEVHR